MNVVGNNVEKNKVKLDECGDTWEEFDTIIGETADKLLVQLTEIKNSVDASSFLDEVFLEELFNRYVKRMEPFKLQ